MGYEAKVTTKGERKKGVEAAKRVGATGGISKQVALAVVKLNRKTFEQVDELDNADLCTVMQEWRDSDSDRDAILWWWRMAHEEAAKGHEEAPDFKEPEFRLITITQFLAAPFDWDAWEDDRIHLKPGVEPWISDEQIQAGLDRKSIKRWAYIWHWRDIYTEEDEITDRNCQRKAGERKFAHVHIVCEAPGKVALSQVCRWFGVPPTQVKILRGQGAFAEMMEYLPHESPKAVEQGKTHYDYDEIVPKTDTALPVEHITKRSPAKLTKSGRIRVKGGHAHSQLSPMLEEVRTIQQVNPQASLVAEKTFFPDQRDAELLEWLGSVRNDGFRDPTFLERSSFGGWNVQKAAVDKNGNRILVEMGIGPASRDSEYEWKLTTVFPRHGDKIAVIDTSGEVKDTPWEGGHL